MEYFHLNFLDSQVNLSLVNSNLVSKFSSFINDIWEGDYTPNFTTDEIFPTREDLIKWVRGVTYDLGFIVIILRLDKYNE